MRGLSLGVHGDSTGEGGLYLGVHGDRMGEGFISRGSLRQHRHGNRTDRKVYSRDGAFVSGL